MGRERAGYKYLDTNLHELHVCSVPLTDEAAIEYAKMVDSWFEHSGDKVRFIQAHGFDSHEYVFLPVEIADGEVVRRATDS